MSTLDARQNFCITQALQGYSGVDTSIAVIAGGGASFPDVTDDGHYNLVWFNSTDYSNPALDPDVEIVRVLTHVGGTDAFTIGRAQEGTVATAKNINGKTYTLMLAPTAKMFADIENALDEKQGTINFVDEEVVSGTDGTHWTLAHQPAAGCIPLLLASGAPLTVAAGDFTISGENITTALQWSAGILIARYRY